MRNLEYASEATVRFQRVSVVATDAALAAAVLFCTPSAGRRPCFPAHARRPESVGKNVPFFKLNLTNKFGASAAPSRSEQGSFF